MENKLKNFISNQWHWIIFSVLVFFCLAFLIFQSGVWAFADSGFYYRNLTQAKIIASSKLGLFANTDGFYFGYDNSASAFAHLFVSWYQVALTFIFGSYLGQIIYYFFYYFLIFIFSLKFLAKLLPNTSQTAIRIGALFLTFNPFALLISTLFTISYIYPSFIIFIFNFLQYLEKGKIKNLTSSVFFGVYLLSYLRLIPIIFLASIIIGLLFYNRKYLNFKRLVIYGVIAFLCASPFIVPNFLTLGRSNDIVSNYKGAFSRYQEANYDFKSSFINTFSHPGGFTPSTLSFFYNQRGLPDFADNYAVQDSFEFFKLIQIIFNLGILAFGLTFRDRLNLRIAFLILLIFFLNTLGFFTNQEIFAFLNKSFLVFLYNDYGFLQFIQSFLYAFLIVNVVDLIAKKKSKSNSTLVVSAIIIAYLLISCLPLLLGHYGLKKINEFPKNYEQSLFNQEVDWRQASLFAPYHWLNFSWSPYYLDLNSVDYSKYQSLVIPNLRLVDEGFIRFYNQIYDNLDKDNFSNLEIFNLKNIFLFHDVKDANYNIDTYQVKDLENRSHRLYRQILKRDDFNLINGNENFSHYQFKNANNYDFLIYSPKNLLDIEIDKFYNKKIYPNQKPVILNKTSYHDVNLIGDINFFLNSPFVSYKKSLSNANKYYVKVSVNKDYPFLIQFNQHFSNSWQIYFIDKATWEKASCISEWQLFSETENQRCLIDEPIFDFNLVFNQYLKPENHLRGNYIGNAFLITPEDIPDKYKLGDDLYLVIYFQKQYYYAVSLFISCIIFLILIIATVVETFYLNKK